MRRRRDDRDSTEGLEGLGDDKRDRGREVDEFDTEALAGDLALDDDMGPNSWRMPRIDWAYMYHLRDMTYRQIAEQLHISENTARQYVRKMQRETAPKLKDTRERVVGHAVDRMRGLAMERRHTTTGRATRSCCLCVCAVRWSLRGCRGCMP